MVATTHRRRSASQTLTKQVARFEDGDLASLLLSEFRIESSVLCRTLMAAPWGFSVRSRDGGSFHLVLAGDGWLEVDGSSGPIRLRTGDLAVLPNGNGHRVTDSRTSAAPELTSILEGHEIVNGELRLGGGAHPTTEIVCGTFTVEGGPVPWFHRLPSVVVSPSETDAGDWRHAIAAALRDEARAPTAGGAAVVNRWLESIISDALRTGVSRQSGDGADAAALRDERISLVLAGIHERLGARWTLAGLAAVATMSRSTFSERFRSLVGEPPMAHVTRLRLDRARRLLQASDWTLAEIAGRVGYGSEEALSRAFKARFGAAPSVVRRRHRTRVGA